MPRTRIKICGIKDHDTARIAALAGADAIGLVFVEKSPRFIDIPTARRIVRSLPSFVEPVGLFVDEEPAHIRRVAGQVGLHTVQLHGHETLQHLAALDDFNIIKALSFHKDQIDTSLESWIDLPHHLKSFLWDAAPSATNQGLLGGTGNQINWHDFAELQQSGKLDLHPPSFLAGGLTPTNVGQAIAIAHPYGVDVSSGVESSRGIKDHDLIQQFCAAVHEADTRPLTGDAAG
ncbi:phosphoribosylanthranilate isomerase [Poriferisphaera sp. WC338]|uniref:phosphoribosylanthranilate isomerase n=1 Tax=Poriferisphaera sp. WC338 TaxID=3425129 RepID=UPI003D817B7F